MGGGGGGGGGGVGGCAGDRGVCKWGGGRVRQEARAWLSWGPARVWQKQCGAEGTLSCAGASPSASISDSPCLPAAQALRAEAPARRPALHVRCHQMPPAEAA